MSYAKGTSVAVNKTRQEIEDLLDKHGAIRTACAIEDRHPKYSWRTLPDSQSAAMCEQARRELWRALLLTIKAKLVSVESGVESFEQAFLAHVVLPGGETVGERAAPMLADAYSTGQVRGFLEAGADHG